MCHRRCRSHRRRPSRDPTGAAATVAVGNTITGQPGTEADVTNTGTSVAANLIFTIPRGEKGDDGSLALISEFPPLP